MMTTTTAIIVAIKTVSQGTQTDPILVTTTRINSTQIEQHSSIAESDADAENKSDAEIQRIMFRYIPKYVASSG